MIQNTSHQTIVDTYCRQVLDGSIVACASICKTVKRYFSDLDRCGEEDFPYCFDEPTAEFYCNCFPALFTHSKGEFANHPFRLAPWQMFIVWQLFGWKRVRDNKRRFRKLFKTIARKNGKSTFAAAVELLLTFLDGEAGAEVYIGATKLDQAKVVHTEAERMLRKSPSLMKVATVHKNNIAYARENAFARPLGSDKPFDGLNPHGVIFDEMHAWREFHRPFYDTLTTGSASRSQPMQVTISTKGDDKSLIFNAELEYARAVVSGEVADETLLVYIFELDQDDDLFDASVWPKANPNLGISVSKEYLEDQANRAEFSLTTRKAFERYHGNRTVTSIDSPIIADDWDRCQVVEFTPFDKAEYIGAGVDLGGHDDLASYAFTFRYQHETQQVKVRDGVCPKCRQEWTLKACPGCEVIIWRYESLSRSFIAEDTKRDLTEEPFATWIDQGKLTVCKYVMTELREQLILDAQRYGCEFVCFDPYQARNLSEELEREGMTPVKMAQNPAQFNETLAEFLSALSEGRLSVLESDEILRWAALNMSTKTSSTGMMPDKVKSKEKIDPMVAVLMSQRASMLGHRRIDPDNLFVS